MKKPFSKFHRLTHRHSTLVDLVWVYAYLISDAARKLTEAIRTALTGGDAKRAADLKRTSVYVCFSGEFPDGHKDQLLATYTGYVVLDNDHLPPERLEELKRLAMQQPGAVLAYITPSGQGLKVVVRTDVTDARYHRTAFDQVANHYDHALAVRSDRVCHNVSRGHFLTYDPLAAFNQQASIFHVLLPDSEEAAAQTETQAAPWATTEAQAPPQPSASTKEFVEAFIVLNPAPVTQRNITLFRLACEAARRGYSCHDIVLAATEQMCTDSFDADEINQTVKSAYRKVNVRMNPNNVRNRKDSDKNDTNDKGDSCDAIFGETADDEIEIPDGEDLRSLTPTFTDKIRDKLPEFLRSAIRYCEDLRESDMLLLSIITVLSSVFYTTFGYYARKKYFPNLFSFVVTPPANSKGILENAIGLLKYYIREAQQNNERMEKQYEADVAAYEKELTAYRKKESGDAAPVRPRQPAYYYPRIPVNISKSRLFDHLMNNGPRGGVMFSVEADALASSSQQDYGDFMDILRSAFHHESIEYSYIIKGLPRTIECPLLSVFLAGTQDQLLRYIPNTANGLFSRELLYTHAQEEEWKDVSPREGEEVDAMEKHFEELAMRLNHILNFLHASPTEVKLTKAQWRKLNKTFGQLLKDNRMFYRRDFSGCIKRHGLMTYRLCMVLSMMDKASLRMDTPEITCSDEHFEAALTITTTCLEHSRLLITSVKSSDDTNQELQNPDKIKLILARLPNEFTFGEFLEIAKSFKLEKRAVNRLLKNSIGQIISRLKKGVYTQKT